MTADQFVKARLVEHVYDEGREGGYNSMLAIALVLRNRVRAGWAGGDWMSVLNRAWAHSAFEPRPLSEINLQDQNLRRLLLDIDDLYAGMLEDQMTEGALYHYDVLRQDGKDGPRHQWFVDKIIRNPTEHARVAQVGMIALFR